MPKCLRAAMMLMVSTVMVCGIRGAYSQAPAPARQLGTVTAISAGSVTLKTATEPGLSVTVAPEVSVLQLAPGSTDLKSATPAKLEDVAVGDRVLVSGTRDAAQVLVASRIILMKSTDIAARNSAEERDWQRRGLGGLVRAVAGPEITIVSGAKVLKVSTTPQTVYKKYASDSVEFADAKPGTLGEIRAGDQMRARGAIADDRQSMTADEVVYGAFQNLSGVISAVDQTAQTLTLKDLATKKVVTVYVTQRSNLRKLSSEASASFLSRNSAGGAGGSGVRRPGDASATGKPAGGGPPAGGASGTAGAGADAGGARAPRSAGMDLSQMLSHLPTQTLADLHTGEAVMIVASEDAGPNETAITLLSGVEQILSSTSTGGTPITLSPWNLGGAPEGGDAGGR